MPEHKPLAEWTEAELRAAVAENFSADSRDPVTRPTSAHSEPVRLPRQYRG